MKPKIEIAVCHRGAKRSFLWRCGGIFIALFFALLSTTTAQTVTYTLGLTAVLVGPAAGSNSVVLAVSPATGSWTASANANWLHLSVANQNGTGSTNVIFSYDANTGGTRTGTLPSAGKRSPSPKLGQRTRPHSRQVECL